MSDHARPLHRVEVRRAIVTPHGIQQVIQNTDTDPTPPFTHRRYHPPLVGLGIVALYTGNGVTAAPTTNCKAKILFLQCSTQEAMAIYHYKCMCNPFEARETLVLIYYLKVLTCKEYLSTADGFSWPGSGPLHQRPLLRQQQVILSFINQVSERIYRIIKQGYISSLYHPQQAATSGSEKLSQRTSALNLYSSYWPIGDDTSCKKSVCMKVYVKMNLLLT